MAGPSGPARAPPLTEREREALRALVASIAPANAGPPDRPTLFQLGGEDRGLDEEVARLWANYFSRAQQEEFRQLLRVVDSRFLNLILTGRPQRFTGLAPGAREHYLNRWAVSRLGVKRRGFQSIKRLVTFLYYARPEPDGTNPIWPAIGYTPSASPVAGPIVGPAPRPAGLLDASAGPELACEVVVVGSGAGGSVVAATLAQAGRSVLVLESGPYRDRTGFTGREAETMESLFQRQGLLTTRDLAFQVLAGATAGGSTVVNWMTCLRPSAVVRAEWEAAGATGVAGPDFDGHLDAVWRRLDVGRTESTVNPANHVLELGAERRGYARGVDFDVIDRNAVGCRGRCDYCSFGCPYDAKRSALVTYLADALAAGARLLCDTQVDQVRIEGDRAVGVLATIRGPRGPRPLRVRARAVVVAGGAVQTPALLQRSGLTHRGIGVGLRLHPTTALLGEFPYLVEPWRGPMQSIVVRRSVRSDAGEHGPWLEVAPAHPGLAGLATPWTGGADHKATMARFPRVAPTIVLVRDVGEGRVGIDADGAPVLEYRLDDRDRANLVRGLVEAAELQHAAGACRLETLHSRHVAVGNGVDPIGRPELDGFLERVRAEGIVENAVMLFSAHPTGSARIGTDPTTSTTGAYGEVHGVRDLWVGDGSLLPSAPGVNPMITIMAFARRTAEAIRARLAV